MLDLFLILSLVSYSPADPQTLAALGKVPAVSNWAGKVGALIAAWLMGGIGLAAFWLPIMLSWLALQCYQGTLRSHLPLDRGGLSDPAPGHAPAFWPWAGRS